MSKALVVLSGGQDSTTALFIAKRDWQEIHAVTFDYNQRHRMEINAAARIAEMAGCKSWELVDVGAILKGTSPLVDHSRGVEHYESAAALPGGLEKTFVPGRNVLFLTLAANRAYCLEANALVTGLCQEDYGGYPDCRSTFVRVMEMALSEGLYGDGRKLSISTPLMNLTKRQSVELAASLPGCFEALAFSHTCLAKGTLVRALVGLVPIEKLKKGQYVWGWNDELEMWFPSKVKAVLSQGIKEVFRVGLQDGVGRITYVEATADHRFMLREGGYAQLDQLKKGDRLKNASVWHFGKYLGIRPHNLVTEPISYMHRHVAHCLGFEAEIIHHKDENGHNNDPSNLEGMDWGKHSSIHYGAMNAPDSVRRREATAKLRGVRSIAARQCRKNYTRERAAAHARLLTLGREKARQARHSQANHVITSIERVEAKATFDINTETQNFALGSGVFVHNCYDGEYPPNPHNHASLLRARGFAQAGLADPLIRRAKGEALLPADYPDSGLVEGTKYDKTEGRAAVYTSAIVDDMNVPAGAMRI